MNNNTEKKTRNERNETKTACVWNIYIVLSSYTKSFITQSQKKNAWPTIMGTVRIVPRPLNPFSDHYYVKCGVLWNGEMLIFSRIHNKPTIANLHSQNPIPNCEKNWNECLEYLREYKFAKLEIICAMNVIDGDNVTVWSTRKSTMKDMDPPTPRTTTTITNSSRTEKSQKSWMKRLKIERFWREKRRQTKGKPR